MELEAQSKKLELDAASKKLGLEVGWIGMVVGSPKNAPYNLAFLILVLTFTAGFVFAAAFPNDRMEFWKLIVPIITLTIGYVLGTSSHSTKKNSDS
jgi:hypothetical protein